jgi:hypothetical protein
MKHKIAIGLAAAVIATGGLTLSASAYPPSSAYHPSGGYYGKYHDLWYGRWPGRWGPYPHGIPQAHKKLWAPWGYPRRPFHHGPYGHGRIGPPWKPWLQER